MSRLCTKKLVDWWARRSVVTGNLHKTLRVNGNIGSVGVSNPIAPDPQALSIACILYLNWCCFVGSKIDSWRLSQAVRCISVVNGLIGRGISLIDRSIALTPLSGGINLSDPPKNKLGKPSNNSLIHLFVLSVLFTNL